MLACAVFSCVLALSLGVAIFSWVIMPVWLPVSLVVGPVIASLMASLDAHLHFFSLPKALWILFGHRRLCSQQTVAAACNVSTSCSW
jgi:hypothetical protein